MLNFLLCALFEFWVDYMAATSLELPMLVTSAFNAIYCISVAIKSNLFAPHTAYGKLSEEQMRLLGVSDKGRKCSHNLFVLIDSSLLLQFFVIH